MNIIYNKKNYISVSGSINDFRCVFFLLKIHGIKILRKFDPLWIFIAHFQVDITPLIAPSLLSKNGKEAELYKKDVPSDKYVLVLEGRAQVTIGVVSSLFSLLIQQNRNYYKSFKKTVT